ncbi:ABC transporter permease subunit [Bacillus sp. JJ1609]|uniref:ABC transporter permease subunit n=1 Tax=Bacillus sp. JJ1609 TaxID=3122977 RepID=UPI002FFFDDEC
MELVKGIIKSITTWFFASVLLTFIILIPRDVSYESTDAGVFKDATYTYSFEKHKAEFIGLYTYIKGNKSLGDYTMDYTVEEILGKTLKRSAMTVIPALILGYFLGILKGVFDHRLSLRKWGFFGKGSTWFFLSLPDFFIVITLQIILMDLFYKGLVPHIDLFGSDNTDNIYMQIIYLMIYPLFYMATITSSAIEEETGKDYVRTARSKGLKEIIIVYRHILANIRIKMLRHFNTIVLYMLSNLFIIERFTDYRGAGYFFLKSIYIGPVFAVGSDRNLGMPILAIAYTLIFTAFILIVHIISLIAVYKSTPYDMGDKL